MLKIAQLRGYILEEVLAKLMKSAGYDLIGPGPGEENLDQGAHGLLVRGRGAWHQVDALGQFRWTPPFNFPIRLFLEAKFMAGRIGISYVRQAVGITSDINQSISPIVLAAARKTHLTTAHHYSYALASTTGFTEEAAQLALAHQVSLIDLTPPEYKQLLDRIDDLARAVIGSWQTGESVTSEPKTLKTLRQKLRTIFQTSPSSELIEPTADPVLKLPNGEDASQKLHGSLAALSEAVNNVSELFLGTANGPFMLLLKADNPTLFLEYARQHRRHTIEIHWRGRVATGHTWEIRPAGALAQGYRLTFRLPDLIADWILTQGESTRRAALAAKAQFLARISIYRFDEFLGDELFQLEFDPEQTRRNRLP